VPVEEPRAALPPLGAASVPAPAAYRAVQILEMLAAKRGPLTVSELALRVPLAKSTVSNLLTTLEATGMVRRVSAGWVLSWKALEIGQAVLASTDLVSEFRRHVTTLPILCTETTLLAVLEEADVLYLARHDGDQHVRLASDVGRRLPATVTSLGKAMLASLPEAQLELLLADVDTLPRPTRRSHPNKAALLGDLAETRRRGFAIDDEENTIGVTCFGVAVPDASPPVAVSCTLVTQRLTPQLRAAIVADLTALAGRLSAFARA
jgi:DNA-binding IclR family transcriptional regulator